MRMPLVCREREKYVCVLESGWRERYSRSVEVSVCSYVLMMSWLWCYYKKESVLEKEMYEGEVSPLLCEMSVCDEREVKRKKEVVEKEVLDAYAQLLYVLPEESWKLCGVESELKEISESVLKEDSVWESESGLLCKYEWAYNEYFWECVPRLKKISIETLEKWNEASKLYRNAKDKKKV